MIWKARNGRCSNTAILTKGTDFGYERYEKYGVPHFEIVVDSLDSVDAQIERAIMWLRELDDDAIVVSIGGLRTSEYPGIFEIAQLYETLMTPWRSCHLNSLVHKDDTHKADHAIKGNRTIVHAALEELRHP